MKKIFYIFTILCISILSTKSFADNIDYDSIVIPEWYTGNQSLYRLFVQSCNVAKKNGCDVSCVFNDEKSWDIAHKTISNCGRNQIKSCQGKKCDFSVSAPAATASVRG